MLSQNRQKLIKLAYRSECGWPWVTVSAYATDEGEKSAKKSIDDRSGTLVKSSHVGSSSFNKHPFNDVHFSLVRPPSFRDFSEE